MVFLADIDTNLLISILIPAITILVSILSIVISTVVSSVQGNKSNHSSIVSKERLDRLVRIKSQTAKFLNLLRPELIDLHRENNDTNYLIELNQACLSLLGLFEFESEIEREGIFYTNAITLVDKAIERFKNNEEINPTTTEAFRSCNIIFTESIRLYCLIAQDIVERSSFKILSKEQLNEEINKKFYKRALEKTKPIDDEHQDVKMETKDKVKHVIVSYGIVGEEEIGEALKVINTVFQQNYMRDYSHETIKEKMRKKEMQLIVAYNEKSGYVGVVAHSTTKPIDGLGEILTLAVLPEFRRYGIAKKLMQIADKLSRTTDYTSVHTQCINPAAYYLSKELGDIDGVRPVNTGFVFNEIKNFERYGTNTLAKLSTRISVRPHKKKELSAKLFVPREVEPIAVRIYRDLNVSPVIKNTADIQDEKESIFQEVSSHFDQKNATLHLVIDGNDLELQTKITNQINLRKTIKNFTVTAYINILDASSLKSYETLKKLGFFFSGFIPLAKNEYIVMNYDVFNPVDFPALEKHFASINEETGEHTAYSLCRCELYTTVKNLYKDQFNDKRK